MSAAGTERVAASREILYLDLGHMEPAPRERDRVYPMFLDLRGAALGVLCLRSAVPLAEEQAYVEEPERNRNLVRDKDGNIIAITFFEPHESGVNIGGLPADPNLPTTLELQGFFALHEIKLAK